MLHVPDNWDDVGKRRFLRINKSRVVEVEEEEMVEVVLGKVWVWPGKSSTGPKVCIVGVLKYLRVKSRNSSNRAESIGFAKKLKSMTGLNSGSEVFKEIVPRDKCFRREFRINVVSPLNGIS